MLFFVLCLSLFGSGDASNWRLRATKQPVNWRLAVQTLTFFSDSGCNNEISVTRFIESNNADGAPGGYFGAQKAFDKNDQTAWGGRGAAGDNTFWIGAQGLPDTILCVRALTDATEIVIERSCGAAYGGWKVVKTITIAAGTGKYTLPSQAACPVAQAFCTANQYVSAGKCVACASNSCRNAGDDTLGGNTICESVPPAVSYSYGTSKIKVTEFSTDYVAKHTDNTAASCKGKMFVGWTSQATRPMTITLQKWGNAGDTAGHMSSFDVSSSGVATQTGHVKLDNCMEMGGVVASTDCSLVAALCVSRTTPAQWGSLLKQNFVDDTGRTTYGFYQEPNSDGSGSEAYHMYLLEWKSGVLKTSPDSVILVNRGVGRWRMGNWEISLNAANTEYTMDLEVMLYTKADNTYHEGDVLFTATRTISNGITTKLTKKSSSWSCNFGHTLLNHLTYNSQKDITGRWCRTDGSKSAGGGVYSSYFGYTGQETQEVHVLGSSSIFGPTNMISFGNNGWMGAMEAKPNQCTGTKLRSGIVQLNDPKGAKSIKWLGPADKDSERVMIATVGTDPNAARFLVGWLEGGAEYVMGEVNQNGTPLGSFFKTTASGWDDRSQWVTIPSTGCVAWAHAWDDSQGPTKTYKDTSTWTQKLRISTYCAGGSSVPSPTPRPPTAPTPKPASGGSGHSVVAGSVASYGTTYPERCLLDSSTMAANKNGARKAIGVTCCDSTGKGTRPGCKTGSYATAVAICQAANLQLCTKAQITAGSGRGQGCGQDASHVWTRSACSPAIAGAEDGEGPELEGPDDDYEQTTPVEETEIGMSIAAAGASAFLSWSLAGLASLLFSTLY